MTPFTIDTLLKQNRLLLGRSEVLQAGYSWWRPIKFWRDFHEVNRILAQVEANLDKIEKLLRGTCNDT